MFEVIAKKARGYKALDDYVNKLDCMPCPKAPRNAIPSFPQIKGGDWVIYDDIVIQETETKKMYKDERTAEQQAKDYLIDSLDQALSFKRVSELDAFGLVDKYPKTVGELKQMVADGWLRIETGERADEKHIYSWMDYLVFNDPKRKPDREGYDAAVKTMVQEASDVKDQIVVYGPEKGLEALNAFKAKTFH